MKARVYGWGLAIVASLPLLMKLADRILHATFGVCVGH